MVSFTFLYPRERALGTHCIGGWVDPRALGTQLRRLSRPASRYNDCTTAVPELAMRGLQNASTGVFMMTM